MTRPSGKPPNVNDRGKLETHAPHEIADRVRQIRRELQEVKELRPRSV
jgi:hypothetical protein